MSRRHLIRKFQLLENLDSSIGGLSVATDVSGVDFITYQVEVDPGANALLNVFFGNDDHYDASTSVPLDFKEPLVLDGSIDTNYVVEIENKGFKWLQIEIQANGGSGPVSAWITGAGRGA